MNTTGEMATNLVKTEESYELSICGKAELTKEGCNKHMLLDITKESHLEKLRCWCTAHWNATFRRSLMYGNRLTFHWCCICFTRRAFCKVAGHPPLESVSIMQIPCLRVATGPQDLYNWLLDIAKQRMKLGEKMLFPSINMHHIEKSELEQFSDDELDYNMLQKRITELQAENGALKDEVERLRRANQSMLNSTKNWHKMYQELEEKIYSKCFTYKTPLKPNLTLETEFPPD